MMVDVQDEFKRTLHLHKGTVYGINYSLTYSRNRWQLMGLKRTILEKVNGYSILIRPSSAAQPQGLKERHGMN